eukprot:TRINITY_DN17963_c0_g1_i1.p1 TRINITY_DN17963_c0_g1~~TRINITY_DN17963_c0_g1_i1.p1  ORF type:complete len:617 (+),score=160.15 TRINITY_DN17963_c0_g1_i1:95-1945(+)
MRACTVLLRKAIGDATTKQNYLFQKALSPAVKPPLQDRELWGQRGADGLEAPDFSHVKWEAERGEDYTVIDVPVDNPSQAEPMAPTTAAAVTGAHDGSGRSETLPEGEVALAAAAEEALGGCGHIEFGIEIDCVLDEPMTRATVAHDLTNHSFNHDPYQRLPHEITRMQFVPTDYSDRTGHNWWKVKPDYHHIKSTSGQKVKSFQLVSPVLSTANPRAALHRITTAVAMARDIGARTHPSGGLHLHINVAHMSILELKRALWRLLALEQGLDQLVPIDRLQFGDDELASNRMLLEAAAAGADSPRALLDGAANIPDLVRRVCPTGRFAKVNLTNLLLQGVHKRDTIELRAHHAVLDPTAVAVWVGLAARMCSPFAPTLPGVDDAAAFPTPRNAWRALDTLLAPSPFLQSYVRTRRKEIRRLHAAYQRNTISHLEASGGWAAGAGLLPGVAPLALPGALSGAGSRAQQETQAPPAITPSAGKALQPLPRSGRQRSLSVVRNRRRCPTRQVTQLLSNPALVSGLMRERRAALVDSGAVLKTANGDLLSYRHGALTDIAPRDAAKREAFPIITSGAIVRSVDSDATEQFQAASQHNNGISKENRNFVPDADPLDPVTPQ